MCTSHQDNRTGYLLVLVPLIALCISFIIKTFHNRTMKKMKFQNTKGSQAPRHGLRTDRWRTVLDDPVISDPLDTLSGGTSGVSKNFSFLGYISFFFLVFIVSDWSIQLPFNIGPFWGRSFSDLFKRDVPWIQQARVCLSEVSQGMWNEQMGVLSGRLSRIKLQNLSKLQLSFSCECLNSKKATVCLLDYAPCLVMLWWVYTIYCKQIISAIMVRILEFGCYDILWESIEAKRLFHVNTIVSNYIFSYGRSIEQCLK